MTAILRRGTPESFGWVNVTNPECRKLGCQLDVWERPNGVLKLREAGVRFRVVRKRKVSQ